jgi:hypothetical protein
LEVKSVAVSESPLILRTSEAQIHFTKTYQASWGENRSAVALMIHDDSFQNQVQVKINSSQMACFIAKDKLLWI